MALLSVLVTAMPGLALFSVSDAGAVTTPAPHGRSISPSSPGDAGMEAQAAAQLARERALESRGVPRRDSLAPTHAENETKASVAGGPVGTATGIPSGGSIAFAHNHNIWLTSPDGSTQRQLTTDGTATASYRDPSQSEDGQVIVAVQDRPEQVGGFTRSYIYEMDRNGSLLRPPFAPWQYETEMASGNACTGGSGLVTKPFGIRATVSPDGTMIVVNPVSEYYRFLCPQWLSQLYVIDLAGSYVTGFIEDEGGDYLSLGQPSWAGNTRLLLHHDIELAVFYYDLGAETARFWVGYDWDSSTLFQPMTYHYPSLRAGVLATSGYNEDRVLVIRVWTTNGGPPAAPTARCDILVPPDTWPYPTPRLAPDGASLAWTKYRDSADLPAGVYVSRMGNIGAGTDCSGFNAQLLVAGGLDAFWGSAPMTTTAAGRYTPLTPARILDTRTGTGGISAPVGPGASVDVQVTGQGGVPASGVSAVAMNVTVTQPTAAGFLTLWPTGATRPLAANLNFTPDKTVPNLVVVKVGAGGKVALFNSSGSSHVIFDVAGWYSEVPVGNDGRFQPLVPARILDTRDGTGAGMRLTPGASLDLQVGGRGGLPASGAGAAVLNVAVTGTTATSFLTVYPTGQPMPLAANLNYVAGDTVSNRVMAKLGTGGKLTIYNNAGSTDVVVDVNGWYSDASVTGTSGVFNALVPARILDTRDGTGGIAGARDANTTTEVQVSGQGGVPASGVSAVILNATVAQPSAGGFLTIFPTGAAKPWASDLNYAAGETRPNLVVVKVGTGGKVSLFTSAGTHVVFDVAGWMS